MYYFDHAATTPIYEEILDTYQTVARDYFANPSSAHLLGVRSKELLDQAREQVAHLLNYEASEIYFTSSGSESNNWVLTRVLEKLAERHPDKKGIIFSSIEHPSVYRIAPYLADQGFTVYMIPVKENGQLDFDAFRHLLEKDILLVSTLAVNNELGMLLDVNEVAKILADYPQVLWHVDGVQAVSTQFERIKHPRIDCLSLSGHKFHAPRGGGVLAMRERVPKAQFLYGGGQEGGLRASTENLPAIVCVSKALRLAWEKQEETKERLQKNHDKIVQVLKESGWHVFNEGPHSEHIVCAALPPIPGEVLLHAFEEYDIYVSTTSACSSRVASHHSTLSSLGVAKEVAESAIRISMSTMTQADEVEHLLETIPLLTQQFEQ